MVSGFAAHPLLPTSRPRPRTSLLQQPPLLQSSKLFGINLPERFSLTWQHAVTCYSAFRVFCANPCSFSSADKIKIAAGCAIPPLPFREWRSGCLIALNFGHLVIRVLAVKMSLCSCQNAFRLIWFLILDFSLSFECIKQWVSIKV